MKPTTRSAALSWSVFSFHILNVLGFFLFFFYNSDNCWSCLQEKAILSTQVLKLEKELKKMKGKMLDRENQVSQTLMKTHHTSVIRYDVS